MKKTIIALSVATVAAMGMFSIAPSANAAGIGHYNCKGGQSYDVKKGKCIVTVGATSYSPTMHKHHKHMKKHMKKQMMK